VERAAHRLAHDLAHPLVPVVHRPATVREAAAVVLAGSARGLHDPVEGEEGVHDQLSHLRRPFARVPWLESSPPQHETARRARTHRGHRGTRVGHRPWRTRGPVSAGRRAARAGAAPPAHSSRPSIRSAIMRSRRAISRGPMFIGCGLTVSKAARATRFISSVGPTGTTLTCITTISIPPSAVWTRLVMVALLKPSTAALCHDLKRLVRRLRQRGQSPVWPSINSGAMSR